ncbi:MAG: serine/threonine-protein kinase [Gemmataceae bacterium]|nr:serine/threonine-protein kinase [Gemmataceae bacterium]
MADPIPSRPSADRNLLFGILALQMDFISRDGLVQAMNAWVLAKAKPLGQILIEQGTLRPDAYALLEPLVQKHLELHGNDPQQSLASVRPSSSVASDLQHLIRDPELRQIFCDPDLQASLALLGSAHTTDPAGTIDGSKAGADSTAAGLRYRILRPHAKGGLGQVHVALDEELHREVALKEIQECHAHDPVSRGRFLLEAEVTGRLEHPGIVPVYGLGSYADGRPFYAMRFVKGDNLKEAIRSFHEADGPGREPSERSLAFRQLLGRFVDVCHAVAYAHSRGVLHRDLKPGNIMLGKYGETLVVDWGLAKPIDRPESTKAVDEMTFRPSSGSGLAATQAGTVVGTPAYMSPEQAAGRLDQVGPASDIYSLGATLYAVLTGRAPFEEGEVWDVIQKVQRGQVAWPRQVKPGTPAALDAICRKAMALQPEDRYPTALALAADVEHWLADEPVSAYREPLRDRLRRWGRRHRPLVVGAAALLVTAVVALAVSTYLVNEQQRATLAALDQVAQERDRALKAEEATAKERDRVVLEQKRADKQAEITRAVNDFLQRDLLLQASPIAQFATAQQADPDLKMRTVLDRASERIRDRFRDQPLIEAAIRHTVGKAYAELGAFATAQDHLEKAVRLFREHLGPDEPGTLEVMEDLGMLHRDNRKGDWGEAIHLECLQARRRVNGEKDHATLTTMTHLAGVYVWKNELSKAEELLVRVLDGNVDVLVQKDILFLDAANYLALTYRGLGQLEKAEALFEKALEAAKRRGGADPNLLLGLMNNLATVYSARGKYREAEELFLKCLEDSRKLLTEDHPGTLWVMYRMAGMYRLQGNLDRAEELYSRAAEGQSRVEGPDAQATGFTRFELWELYSSRKKHTQADELMNKHLDELRSKAGADSIPYGNALALFGLGLLQQGRPMVAEPILRECLVIRTNKQPDVWTTFNAQSMLGGALLGQKKYAEAEPLLLAGYEGMKQREDKIPPQSKVRLTQALERLVQLNEATDKKDQADEWRKKLEESKPLPKPTAKP